MPLWTLEVTMSQNPSSEPPSVTQTCTRRRVEKLLAQFLGERSQDGVRCTENLCQMLFDTTSSTCLSRYQQRMLRRRILRHGDGASALSTLPHLKSPSGISTIFRASGSGLSGQARIRGNRRSVGVAPMLRQPCRCGGAWAKE